MANTRNLIITNTSTDICFLADGSFGGTFNNTGEGNVHLMFDLEAPAVVGGSTVTLFPGDYYESPAFLQGRVAAISETSSTVAVTLRGENAFI